MTSISNVIFEFAMEWTLACVPGWAIIPAPASEYPTLRGQGSGGEAVKLEHKIRAHMRRNREQCREGENRSNT